MNFATIPTDEVIQKTVKNLKENGVNAVVVNTKEDAKKKALEILPKGAQVLTMTSVTLETPNLAKEINESGIYDSVRNKLNSLDREKDHKVMQQLGAVPDWAIGSVHALTQDGHVLIASNTGSQLPAYGYGANHVIWVVGAQKIVKNFEEGLKRVYEHTLPLESERARKAYGVPGSAVNKLLVVNKEVNPQRITIILVKEVLGF